MRAMRLEMRLALGVLAGRVICHADDLHVLSPVGERVPRSPADEGRGLRRAAPVRCDLRGADDATLARRIAALRVAGAIAADESVCAAAREDRLHEVGDN